MNWRKALTLAPVCLGALSLWLPWVAHPAAALVLTGLDIPEFVRFMGTAGASLVTPSLVAFAAPLVAAALAGSLAVRVWSGDPWLQALVLVIGLGLVSVAFSPLERRTEFVLGASLVAAAWLGGARMRPRERLVAQLALAAGALAPALAVAQFARAAPAVSMLYGRPVQWGIGAYTAMAAAILAGALLLAERIYVARGKVAQRTRS